MSRRVTLARRPEGMPREEDFRIEAAPDPGALAEGELLIANRILSIDPAIRGFLDDRESYLPPVPIGGTVRSMMMGEVIASRRADMPEGTLVRALAGWEDVSRLPAEAFVLEKVAPAPGVALSHYMGALGASGLTAWVGLHEIGALEAGQTVLVTAAAGAVGSLAGQIAKLKGARVVGVCGSAEKAALLLRLGFDAAIDYRAEPDLAAAVRAACPDGIDLFFDNVGGATLESILPLMAQRGHVVACGMVADYNRADRPHGVTTLWELVAKRLTVRGFLTYDHPELLPRAQAELDAWVASGALVPLESLYRGIEAAPGALADMLSGRTTGKTLVMLDNPMLDNKEKIA